MKLELKKLLVLVGQLGDVVFQLRVLQGLRGLTALTLQKRLMTQRVLDVHELFGAHFNHLRKAGFPVSGRLCARGVHMSPIKSGAPVIMQKE